MSKITTTVKYIVAFVYAFIFAIYLCFLPIKIIVNAQEIEYTEVLDDLMKDKTFDVSKYPSFTYEELSESSKTSVYSISCAFTIIFIGKKQR